MRQHWREIEMTRCEMQSYCIKRVRNRISVVAVDPLVGKSVQKLLRRLRN